ncbi:MAG TPA: MFS transporter [Actinomycetales bacterium]|nr:MFS transporter [Actinomycetales bacterium]
MTLAPYRRLLAVPAVRSLLLVGVIARIPHTAAGIALTLHVVETLGLGYGAAGLVGASATIGMAVGAPWRGRAIDRFGLRRALVPSVIAEGVVWTAAPFLPYGVLLAAAAVGGLLALPVFTVVRQSIGVLVAPDQRRSGYSIDSIGVELSFMAGPALAVVAATQLSTAAALIGVGVTGVLGGLALMWLDPPTRSEQVAGRRVGGDVDRGEVVGSIAPASAAGSQRAELEPGAVLTETPATVGTPWRTPALLAVLLAAAGATIVLAGTDVAVVAVLRATGDVELTGLVFAAWGVGSIAGALVYGAWPTSIHPLWLLLALGALTAPVGLATSPWLLALAILPAGALCAPTISATSEAIARLVPERVRGEAMGLQGSALTIGSAVGAPGAGFVIDHVAPGAGFAAVGLAGVAVALLFLAVMRARRPRESSPTAPC